MGDCTRGALESCQGSGIECCTEVLAFAHAAVDEIATLERDLDTVTMQATEESGAHRERIATLESENRELRAVLLAVSRNALDESVAEDEMGIDNYAERSGASCMASAMKWAKDSADWEHDLKAAGRLKDGEGGER